MSHQIILASTVSDSKIYPPLEIEDLEKMLIQINQHIIPIGLQQDPRLPPSGRVIGGKIETSTQGGHSLIGDIEIFGQDVNQLQKIENKEIKVKTFTEPVIIYDQSYSNPNDQELLYNLKVLLNGQLEQDLKKAYQSISTLLLGFNFSFGTISNSMKKMYGKNISKEMLAILNLLLPRHYRDEEKIFLFLGSVKHGNAFFNIEIIFTNPEPKELLKFFNKHLAKFDKLLLTHYKPGKGIRKMTYQYKKGEFELQYILMKNGIPMILKARS